MQNKCKCKTDLKQKEILIGDFACEMPFEIQGEFGFQR